MHLCVFKSVFASERVHMGVRPRAPQLRFTLSWVGGWDGGGWGGIPSDSDPDRKVSVVTPNLGRGSDNLQWEWAATEGDSVK